MIRRSNETKYVLLMLILAGVLGCRTGSDKAKSEEKEQIIDVDGNLYNTITIGDQVWMEENLKTTRYNDGTPIPMVENYDEWAELTLPAYCWYNNDSLNGVEFGALYNGYVIESEKLCPEGWHVPTDEEWKALETAVGGADVAGGALKEAGTDFWKTPNTGASNNSGFSARPGGYRSYDGPFNLKRTYGFWWTSSLKSWYGAPPRFLYREIRYNGQDIRMNISEKGSGLSVRCIKNP
jgi:uncharacterized protein (TIGR02145 family)